MYGILPQDVATDVNLSQSLKQWLYQKIKLPYDTQATALSLNNGYQWQADGTWIPDNNGTYIVEGNGPTDPRLWERMPCVMYQIDDVKATRLPKPTGCGDGANYEFIPILLCCVPPPLIATDGTAEPDTFTRAVFKTCVRNAVQRSWRLPIVDRSQGQTAGLYPVVGFADIMDQRIIAMPNELKQMQVNKRERFDATFTLRWPVVYTNG